MRSAGENGPSVQAAYEQKEQSDREVLCHGQEMRQCGGFASHFWSPDPMQLNSATRSPKMTGTQHVHTRLVYHKDAKGPVRRRQILNNAAINEKLAKTATLAKAWPGEPCQELGQLCAKQRGRYSPTG